MTTIKEIAAHFSDIMKPAPLMACQFEDGSGFCFNYQILGEPGSPWHFIRLK